MSDLNANELTTLAYRKVKEMIISQELKPGQKIVQDKLAIDLGISRTPLRSALQMLEAEFLIESIPRKGVIVREFSNDKIIEIYDCRIALEGMAVRLFTENISEVQSNKLKKFFQSYIDKKKPINIKKYQIEDTKFHDFIIANCGNSFLIKLFQQGNLLTWINRIGLVRPPEETISEHLAIIEAITDKDVEQAEILAVDHLEKSKKLIFAKMKK